MGTVLLGGGRGFIGQALCKELRRRGYDCVLLSRNKDASTPPGVNLITWDRVKHNGLPKCEAVVNLAGTNIMFPYHRWTDSFKRELYESRVGTNKLLATAIESMDEPPQVFVSASAVGYYHPSTSATYDEDSSGGDDFFAKLCAAWEEAAKIKVEKDVRQVVVRTGVVLGRGGGVIQYSLLPFYLGLGGRVASGSQWFPWIHVQDLVGIYVHAIDNPAVSGTLNGVSPGICSNEEFTSALARSLRRPACIPVPEFAVNLIFGEERGKLLTHGQNVKPKRTLQSGYTFVYPDIESACMSFVS